MTVTTGATSGDVVSAIEATVVPGVRVAVGDGAGAPLALWDAVSRRAAEVGGVEQLVGWTLSVPPAPPWTSFARTKALLGGYGIRDALRTGEASYVPVRYGTLPALLAGAMRPDVVLVAAVEHRGSWWFASEVAWMPAALHAATGILVEIVDGLPRASAVEVPRERVLAVVRSTRRARDLPARPPAAIVARLAARVAALVPRGAAVQVPPGVLGDAILNSLDRRVRIWSGVLGGGVAALGARRLLDGEPVGTYLAGGADLYSWADGRALLHPIETTHAPARLAGIGLHAVSTALEVDRTGQVNVERTSSGATVGGVGGQPDFAAAAAHDPEGLSIVAVPTRAHGRSTLVEPLSAPVSTARSEVEMVVTEYGTADLRGRTDAERAVALERVWEP